MERELHRETDLEVRNKHKAKLPKSKNVWGRFKDRLKHTIVAASISAVSAFSMNACGFTPIDPYESNHFIPGEPCGDSVCFSVKVDEISDLETSTNCTDVSFDVRIESAVGLKNPGGLESILCIWDDLLVISNPDLQSLKGLDNLERVTSAVGIAYNESLQTLEGLNSLENIYSLELDHNPLLVNLQALANLSEIKTLNIKFNDSLENLDGLDNLGPILQCTICQFRITDNPMLRNIDALAGITEIWDMSTIISDNPSLESLEGFRNLATVGPLVITGNSSLIDVDGLRSLERINGGDLTISENASLEDLRGLHSLVYLGGDLTITNNPALPLCEAEMIRDLLIANGWAGKAELYGNNPEGTCEE